MVKLSGYRSCRPIGPRSRRRRDHAALAQCCNAHEIDTKSSPTDLVTIADRGAEAALSRALTTQYPGSVVVGEETFAADPDCLAHLDGAHPVWIIDPIDGTGAFTRGEESFAVMLALARGQSLDAAWILQPVSGDLYMAARGSGVRRVTAAGVRTALTPEAPAEPSDMTGIVSGYVIAGRTKGDPGPACREIS